MKNSSLVYSRMLDHRPLCGSLSDLYQSGIGQRAGICREVQRTKDVCRLHGNAVRGDGNDFCGADFLRVSHCSRKMEGNAVLGKGWANADISRVFDHSAWNIWVNAD